MIRRSLNIAYLTAVLQVVGAIFGAIAPCAPAQTISVPNALDLVEADSGWFYPFEAARFPQTVRFQQVYAASEFSQIAGGGWIDYAMYFRVDSGIWKAISQGDVGSFGITLTNVDVRLSTTSRAPDGLSPVFSENVGSDETIVHSDSLSFGGAYYRFDQPQPWNIVVPLSSAFYYRPAKGNLLLDVRVNVGYTLGFFDQFIVPPFDAANDKGDSVSSVYAGSVDALSGTNTTLGMVTRFDIAVPTLQATTVTNYVIITAPILPNVPFVLQQSSSIGPNAYWQPVTSGEFYPTFARYRFPVSSVPTNAYFRAQYGP